MISFLLCYNKKNESAEFFSKPTNIKELNSDEISLTLWGDPIGEGMLRLNSELSEKEIIENVSGHYYYLLFNKKKKRYSIGNSVFALLPVYYSLNGDNIYFSESPLTIADKIGKAIPSKRFILENVLFNYPLFEHSCLEGIKLLSVNSCVQLWTGNFDLKKLVNIADHFVNDPIPWRKSVEDIAEQFIQQTKKYLPDESYLVSLTGGFDGRSLTAVSLYYKKNLKTYCFGSSESTDVKIANELSKISGKEHLRITLEKDYIEKESLECGTSFIRNSNGTASFSRAHYLYASKKLNSLSKYLVTGNFGSEVFRAAHITGVLISKNLHTLFAAQDFDKAIQLIEESSEWKALNSKEFKKEWQELTNDLKKLPCFDPAYKHLTKSQQFYIILFDEVIRKYFGAEMLSQFKVMANRTPFLDLTFIKEVLKTELSGAYSDFFTNDPIKRFKGQVVYAHIISKTFKEFGKVKTDKGYKPDDLVGFSGKLSIAKNFLVKRMNKNRSKTDENSVDAAYKMNKEVLSKEAGKHYLFNEEYIKNGTEGKFASRDSFFVALSQLWWLNYLEKKYVG